MKYVCLILFAICLQSCQTTQDKNQKTDIAIDNAELELIYSNDQEERSGEIDWTILMKADSQRRVRVRELLDSGLVKTSQDYHHAAMVFQHGGDSTSYKLAMTLMQEAIKLDSTANKWLLAAATDRYLLSVGKPQIYGTQYQSFNDGPFVIATIDTTQITDEQRKEYGVETLAQQKEKVKRLNSENR